MNVGQSIRIALDMLRLHKLRAFLTMLGVIIGVMSVTIIVMISNGFQSYLQLQFQKLGTDTIIVVFDPGRQARGGTFGFVDGLTTDDVDYIRERVANADIVSGAIEIGSRKVRNGDREMDNPRISAIDANFTELNRLDVQEGRHIQASDLVTRANVCVIGGEIRDRLFPDKQAIGKLITLPGITLEVVGVLEKMDLMGDATERMMFVPLTTTLDKWTGGDNLTYITLRPKPGKSVDETVQAVWEALMVRSNNRPVYRVDSREAIINVLGGVVGVAGAVLAGIAALSLLVGGIGIMNIMLVSVTERTREIGLRKAVGARSAAILTQFLVESATLSLIGGLIGMFIAWVLGSMVTLLSAAKEWPSKDGLAMSFPLSAALAAAAFSAFVGVVFGLYPAISAAKLDPIDALRRE